MIERTISYGEQPIEQTLSILDLLIKQIVEYFQKNRPASIPNHVYETLNKTQAQLHLVNQHINQIEQEKRRLRGLTEVSYLVNSSLELDDVLESVMDTIIQLTKAERGFLMLYDRQGDLVTRIARNWERESMEASEQAFSRTIVNQVATDGQPVLTTNAQRDPRFNEQESVIALNLRSILCVPLRVKSAITGVIYADNRILSGLFTQGDLELLAAFANQSAVAIENARLFASVRQTLNEVTALKDLMDNVFNSIASGVLTTDVEEKIVLCNRAAEQILGLTSQQIVGYSLKNSLPVLSTAVEPHIDQIRSDHVPVQGLEVSPTLPYRGRVDLRVSLSPLVGGNLDAPGFAIVLEDETEKRHLVAQRRLFERMVSPAVIQQLDPDQLALGGKRQQITVLFADIRGFTSFSETLQPEQLVSVLNRYLAAAAEAVLHEEGTVDKFMGDAVMAWFNAPIPQADHTLRAIRAALNIRSAILGLHAQMPIRQQLSFGIGIHRGDAVLGLVGSERRLDYTAIGDSVNTARRIQENAEPGQVLITDEVYAEVAGEIYAKEAAAIQAKGKREPIKVYEVIGLRQAA